MTLLLNQPTEPKVTPLLHASLSTAKAIALAVACCAFCDSSLGDDPAAEMPGKHIAVFRKYCYDCHDASSSEGGVNLEDLSLTVSKDLQTAEGWQKVLDVLNSKEMPPEGEKQVPDKQKTAFLDVLSNQMVMARKILSDSGGTITLRRLNRREYANTLEALLGVRPDVSTLPDDQAASGFDTAGASLFFSSDQLEQHLAVAERTIETALGELTPVTPKKTQRIEAELAANKRFGAKLAEHRETIANVRAWKASGKPPSDFGYLDAYEAKRRNDQASKWLPQVEWYFKRPETKNGAAMMLTIKGGGAHRIKFKRTGWNAGGRYTIRVRAGAYPESTERLKYIRFNGSEVRKVHGTIDKPEIIEYSFIHPDATLGNFYLQQRLHQGRGDKNLWTREREENGLGTHPGLWIDWAELEGPFPVDNRGKTIEQVFFDKPTKWNEARYAKEVIERFAEQAFRSEKPSSEYIDKLLAIYEANRAKKQSVQQALTGSLAIVLSSPSFLYMVEDGGETEASSESPHAPLSPAQLAVRLSYLIWSAPPDDRLMKLGRSGKLTEPDVLREQTDRLLADERATRMIEGFAEQWLELERLNMFEFSGGVFPDFDNSVRASARNEIFETFKTLLRDNLPVRTFLFSDFVVIDDVLGDYYGLDVPSDGKGYEFRKVSVPKDSPRGGLLGTAAVLAMGSDGRRSSPVERGAWVLRHLLNDPPPPAPPNVPQLARLDGDTFGARDLQRAHQEEPQCAQCHRKIDPIGYGMEHFDASGAWRKRETIMVPIKNKRAKEPKMIAISASGKLPDGAKFQDYYQLRTAIAKKHPDFARGFIESLISYGLGRPYGFTDQELADSILSQVNGSKGSPSDYVHALVQSGVFQSKSGGRVATSHQIRTWTDTKGRTIEGALLSADNTVAEVKRADGRVFKIKIETLSAADRDYLSEHRFN